MLDKNEISRNFSSSAVRYDEHSALQREMADDLLSLLTTKPLINPSAILDIGCGTGYLTRKLAELFPAARVEGIDIAKGMIDEAQKQKRDHQRQRMPRRHAIKCIADVGMAHAAPGDFHHHLIWSRIERRQLLPLQPLTNSGQPESVGSTNHSSGCFLDRRFCCRRHKTSRNLRQACRTLFHGQPFVSQQGCTQRAHILAVRGNMDPGA